MSWATQLPIVFHDTFETRIDRLLDDAIRSVGEWSRTWAPDCNVYEDENGFHVQAALPGMEAKDIDVQVDERRLVIKGERKTEMREGSAFYCHEFPEGPFSCSFRLPSYVDQDRATTSFGRGILTIEFPRREETKPRRIMIESQ